MSETLRWRSKTYDGRAKDARFLKLRCTHDHGLSLFTIGIHVDTRIKRTTSFTMFSDEPPRLLFNVLTAHLTNDTVDELVWKCKAFLRNAHEFVLRWCASRHDCPRMGPVASWGSDYLEFSHFYYVSPMRVEKCNFVDFLLATGRLHTPDALTFTMLFMRGGGRLSTKDMLPFHEQYRRRTSRVYHASMLIALFSVACERTTNAERLRYRRMAHYYESAADRFYFLVKRSEFFQEHRQLQIAPKRPQ